MARGGGRVRCEEDDELSVGSVGEGEAGAGGTGDGHTASMPTAHW